jgi:deazaflavin-dependent oxidoreductase (nitroreductase family)
MIDDRTRSVLSRGHTIDITTTGRRTGQPRRIEIVFHNFGGRLYISGLPSRRERKWLLNLRADPRITLHLRHGGDSELQATAREITDPAERRAVLERVAWAWHRDDVDVMVEHSPLIEVLVEGLTPVPAA